MTSRAILLMSLASLTVVGSMGLASSASALTMKECSAKYQAAKTAGTLNGQKWNDFRTTQCSADAGAAAAAPAAAAPATTAPAAKTAKTTAAAKVDASEPDATKPPAAEPAKPTTAAPAGVTFPAKVDAKYASVNTILASMYQHTPYAAAASDGLALRQKVSQELQQEMLAANPAWTLDHLHWCG